MAAHEVSLGKPEALKHGFQEYWSRRITDEHRLVHKIVDAEIRIDGRLALALLPFAVLIVTVPFWLARVADRQGVALRTRLGKLHAEAVDGVHGLRELVLFGQVDAYRRRHPTGVLVPHAGRGRWPLPAPAGQPDRRGQLVQTPS